jgi:hypothetical protein
MIEKPHEWEKFAAEIKAGRPENYYNYVYETYGTIFQSGSIQGIETFREILRHILVIGNGRSTVLFAERFFPILTKDAREKIFAAFVTELQMVTNRNSDQNAKRRLELLGKPRTST